MVDVQRIGSFIGFKMVVVSIIIIIAMEISVEPEDDLVFAMQFPMEEHRHLHYLQRQVFLQSDLVVWKVNPKPERNLHLHENYPKIYLLYLFEHETDCLEPESPHSRYSLHYLSFC